MYQWIPGNGPSQQAIERIRSNALKPAEPMGEAWFMGETRRMFDELVPPNAVKELDLLEINTVLFEISAGTNCFGHFPEWDEWFKYMLPDLIERAGETLWFENNLFQSVVTAFMGVYWGGVEEQYAGFREDVLASLSVTMMDKMFWSGDPDSQTPGFLDLRKDGRGELKLFWNAGESDPSVSASIFFCLKYLHAEEVPAWVDSLLAIQDPLWQGNLMVWFLGAFDLLSRSTILPHEIEKSNPRIEWDHSHLLGSADNGSGFNDNSRFLPEENVRRFFSSMKAYYTEEKILDLAEVFSRTEHLAISTYNVPEILDAKLFGVPRR